MAACSGSGDLSDGGTDASTDGSNTTDGAIKNDGGNKNEGGVKNDAGLYPSPGSVNLATAGNYVILAMSGISTVPTSAVTGDLGLSPAAASYIVSAA
jgi:hypothetical protein